MQTHNQHRENHSMAACINWTFIIIVLVLFLAVLRYDFHRATYAFQSHQKDWFIFYIKLSYAFVMAYFPHFFGTFIFSSCLSHSGYTIVVTSVLRIQTA